MRAGIFHYSNIWSSAWHILHTIHELNESQDRKMDRKNVAETFGAFYCEGEQRNGKG